MVQRDRDLDTICAVATPVGVGGISVIRLSGPIAISIARALCSFLPEKPESHRAYYGILKSLKTKTDGDPIDEVVATYFAKGKSFTGEDTFEISCHGSPLITREILSEMVNAGARTADRGEFTYRSFMNGKIDLVQAESVLSLIESQSKQSATQALRQLQGSVSKELTDIEDMMIWCLAHMEASIDFSTEGLEVVENQILLDKITILTARLQKLVDTFKKGRVLKDGFQLLLTGIPNVGKSSLLNLLLEEERAIVTDIPGTTRDIIEAHFDALGMKVNLIDTAGLRHSDDKVEQIGIHKSYLAQERADGIFFVFDSSKWLEPREIEEISKLDLSKTYLIGNKSDIGHATPADRIEGVRKALVNSPQFQKLQGFWPTLEPRVFIVSALEKKDGERLKTLIHQSVGDLEFEDQAVISQARHWENLSAALKNMQQAYELVANQASPEFMSLEMKEALLRVQETIGKRFDDQIMDRVFKEFCIGK